MTINLSLPITHELKPKITVVGVGGAGGNAVNNMITSHLEGVEFVSCNTDAQALAAGLTDRKVQLGNTITHGLGAGARPEVGRAAAEEALDEILDQLSGSHMVFITAGMGGGTGTGAAPVVAQVAKELGILTVAVVTRPFEMEGNKRSRVADNGMLELSKYVDSLITIPNQKLLSVLGSNTTLLDAFKAANTVLQGAVQGIAELITRPGLINVDFADVRTVMSETGMAMMGSGCAAGDDRAREAAEAAISSPLLEDINLAGAQGILVNVTAGMDLSIGEFQEVGNVIKQFASDEATVVVGTVIDPDMSNQIRVTVVATGLGRPVAKSAPQPQHNHGNSHAHSHAHSPAHSHRENYSHASPAAQAPAPMRVVRRAAPVMADYTDLERPTVQRQRAVGDGLRGSVESEDMLDIPAFLRRQAD